MAELIDVPVGLAGVAVAETEVGDVVGDLGLYHYRGQSAPDLARTATFEEAVALVLDRPEPETAAGLATGRSLPDGLAPLATALDIRSALSALAARLDLRPLPDLAPAEQAADAVALIAAMPTLIASCHHGRAVEPDPDLGLVADLLRMVGGKPASDDVVRALQSYFVLTIDHGFANSTFATRVVASAGADLGACVLAGFGSLSGPRHGAVLERMLDMYDAIGEPEAAESWLTEELRNRRRLQGFGHSVYKGPDPRLVLMRELAAAVAPQRHRVASAVEEAGTKLLAGRRLGPNVDLFSSVVLEGCGIPRGLFTPIFAASRLAGWCAHAIEQAGESRIIRPAARYIGPPPDVGEVY